MNSLPKKRALNELDIMMFVQRLKIPHFRGIFMRDRLPKKPRQRECGIINLDNNDGPGTHWVAYHKDNASTYYFDSFGNLQPPNEFIKYLGSNSTLHYNHHQYQKFGTLNCGHLCLQFLYDFHKRK